MNRGGVILAIHPLIGRAKRKVCFIKSGINSGIYPRSLGTVDNKGTTTVTGADTQVHAQLSTWCQFGVLHEVLALMHNSGTSESTEQREVGLLVISVT